MDEPHFWSRQMEHVAVALGLAVVMALLARIRLRAPQRSTAGLVLRHPRFMLWIGAFSGTVWPVAAALSLLTLKGREAVVTFGIFALMSALGLMLVAQYYRNWFELRDDGIAFRTTLGGEGRIAWGEIAEVRYAQVWKVLQLKLRSRRVLSVSIGMVGVTELAAQLLARTQPGVIDAKTRELLERAAAGDLPPLYGG